MASPSPAAGGHGAGEEALPASSPPRQEHAWHRHGSSAAPPHAPPPSEEQGRHLASLGGGGWGGFLEGCPLPPPPPGRTSPPRCSTASLLSPCLAAQQGPGRGRRPQPFPWGAGCTGGQRSPAVLGARRGGVSLWAGWITLPGCTTCPWGQQARELACVVGQGPALLAKLRVSRHPQQLSLCIRQATHSLPTSLHPYSLFACLTPVAPVQRGAGLHTPGHGRMQGLCYVVLIAPFPPTPLGPMAMDRDVLCQGQGGSVPGAGEGRSARSRPAALWGKAEAGC